MAVATRPAARSADPNSFANVDCVRIHHIDIDWTTDFVARVLRGHVALHVTVTDETTDVVLDTSHLHITSVTLGLQGPKLEWTEDDPHRAFGTALRIRLPANWQRPGRGPFQIVVHYETTAKCTAAQWLTPSQTAGKQHPYLFTQCQAIHARSLLPCADTPSVKFTYNATVRVPTGLRALMSALPQGDGVGIGNGLTAYDFRQPVAIPSYLLALAVGNIHSRSLGPRTAVWAEPEQLEAAAHEFANTEEYLATAESLTTPYAWGRYDLLVMPPSFPYGGMENPCLTFVTPTLLAGDRSLTSVVAHEIAHSWTGNLVTSANWQHFWLNEGFTVYLERRIIGQLEGEPARQLHALLGRQALVKTVQQFGETSPLTALVPDLNGVDPDDAFSSVPYEKGFAFLYYLEQLVGGRDAFAPYLRAHVEHFQHTSITTEEWKALFLRVFAKQRDEGAFRDVDWDAWFHRPGMPPVESPLDTSLADHATALAGRWDAARDTDGSQFAADEFHALSPSQKVVFLETLEGTDPLPRPLVDRLASVYGLLGVRNSEIRFHWHLVALRAGYEPVLADVVAFITEQGRMKYVRPLYRELARTPVAGDLARTTFRAHASTYHPIAAAQIAKDLGVALDH